MNNKNKSQIMQSPRKNSEVVILSIDDLKKIIKKMDPFSRPDRKFFSLQLSYLSEEQRSYYEQKLSKNYSACGCDLGAALGLISLIIYVLVISISATIHFKLIQILYSMVVFSIGALIGKVFGLAISFLRVKNIIRTLSKMDNI